MLYTRVVTKGASNTQRKSISTLVTIVYIYINNFCLIKLETLQAEKSNKCSFNFQNSTFFYAL